MSASGQCTVVVVDDNEDLRTILSIALQVDGRFDVVAAVGSADDAIREVERCAPDAVLLDLMLSDRDPEPGLQLVRDISEMIPDTAVVAFSGAGNEGLEQRVLAAGGTALVPKGGHVSEIVDALIRPRSLSRGVAVSVRSTFDGDWKNGFVVAGDDEAGYWLQRGDGSTLPGPVDHQRVRQNHD